MQLTGKSIKEQGIIYNLCDKAIQQQGVDVRIDNIYSVTDGGMIRVEGKTILPGRIQIYPEADYENDKEIFELDPGYYEIDLMEGCDIPSNAVADLKSRSSLVRCGGQVRSGQFDGGFKTKQMGCYMSLERPIIIERGARIAQVVVTETETVEEESLYNGQFQNDKQRLN